MFVKLAFLLVLGLAFEKVCADEPESIVGGTDATLGEFPYQVSLRHYGQHICGGTIVSPRHIITAAHCVDDLANGPLNNFHVMTGAVELDSPQAEFHTVKSIRVHPGYIPEAKYSWVNDAAVITLNNPIQFNENQKAIPLATSDPPLKAPLTLSGWGDTRVNGRTPNHLQKALVFYISNEVCEMGHPGQPIYPTHICTLRVIGIGACQGDSGGPLVYQGHLVGIVSWVTPCAEGYPDVYTRVSQYDSFFAEAMMA